MFEKIRHINKSIEWVILINRDIIFNRASVKMHMAVQVLTKETHIRYYTFFLPSEGWITVLSVKELLLKSVAIPQLVFIVLLKSSSSYARKRENFQISGTLFPSGGDYAYVARGVCTIVYDWSSNRHRKLLGQLPNQKLKLWELFSILLKTVIVFINCYYLTAIRLIYNCDL